MRSSIKLKTISNQTFLFTLLLVLILLPSFALAQSLSVKKVIDGDTLLLSNGEKVRLIGVDTPEYHESLKLHKDSERSGQNIATIKALGKKASEFTTKIALGKSIRLEYDQANAHIKHRDRHGRILAYVFLEDGTFLNAEIVRQGYGNAYTKYPFRYMDEFRRYENEAREDRKGLWGD